MQDPEMALNLVVHVHACRLSLKSVGGFSCKVKTGSFRIRICKAMKSTVTAYTGVRLYICSTLSGPTVTIGELVEGEMRPDHGPQIKRHSNVAMAAIASMASMGVYVRHKRCSDNAAQCRINDSNPSTPEYTTRSRSAQRAGPGLHRLVQLLVPNPVLLLLLNCTRAMRKKSVTMMQNVDGPALIKRAFLFPCEREEIKYSEVTGGAVNYRLVFCYVVFQQKSLWPRRTRPGNTFLSLTAYIHLTQSPEFFSQSTWQTWNPMAATLNAPKVPKKPRTYMFEDN
ncbi:hypothetical protein B0H12DRAFT_1256289 [Mycena haematopus]|nr:hypothetical protein B0H12DRAFT_1256289 [Mycena haematopus]